MAFNIPMNVLDTLKCNFCNKYLSVTPVKVIPNKEIKCGRCVMEEDDGVLSNYNIVLEKSKFKCINHFDGCEKMLSPSEVLKHEETCESQYYNCPICTELVATYLMPNHFENNHKGAWLNVSNFTINNIRDIEKCFMYRYEDYLFVIHFISRQNCSSNNIDGTISCSFLGRTDTAVEIKANFTLLLGKTIIEQKIICESYVYNKNNGHKIILDTVSNTLGVMFTIELQKPIICTSINLPKSTETNYVSNDLYFKKRKILLGNTFKKTFPDAMIDNGTRLYLTIDEKKVFINLMCLLCCSLNIYKFVELEGILNQYYVVCEPCFLAQRWIPIDALDVSIFKHIFFFCRLNCRIFFNLIDKTIYLCQHCGSNSDQNYCNNCKQKITQYNVIKSIINHEKECKLQVPQKCPIPECNHYIRLDESSSHFTSQHPQIPLLGLWTTEINLDPATSPLTKVMISSDIYTIVTFTWRTHYWQITLNCNEPNVKPRAVVLDGNKKFVNFIKKVGSIPYLKPVFIHCYIQNPQSAEFEKTISSKTYSN